MAKTASGGETSGTKKGRGRPPKAAKTTNVKADDRADESGSGEEKEENKVATVAKGVEKKKRGRPAGSTKGKGAAKKSPSKKGKGKKAATKNEDEADAGDEVEVGEGDNVDE